MSGATADRGRLRLALAQPRSEPRRRDIDANLRTAARMAQEAAESGADLFCLPETFPGVWREPIGEAPERQLAAIAAEARLMVVGGYPEPVPDGDGACYNTVGVFGADGALLGRYRRTSPDLGDWIYRGGEFWDFSWRRATEVPLIETPVGPLGICVCSELFVPELARIHALGGAQVVLMPAGVIGPGSRLYHAWRVLIEARAIENLAYTAVCANLVRPGDEGLAMVAGPEGVVLDEQGEGVFVCDLDLARIGWLRAQRDRLVDGEKPWAAKPGVLRDWRPADVAHGGKDVWR